MTSTSTPSPLPTTPFAIAVDFGTVGTGTAVLVLRPGADPLDPAHRVTIANAKESTSVLFLRDPTLSATHMHITDHAFIVDGYRLHNFGDQAVQDYGQLVADRLNSSPPRPIDDIAFFSHFKMALHTEAPHRDLLIPLYGSSTPSFRILNVIAGALWFAARAALQVMREQANDKTIRIHDVIWVLTIPAIWTPASKQLMREAAELANIPHANLRLVLEPEAASTCCALDSTNVLMRSDLWRAGLQYLLVDAGGGTIDSAVHKLRDDQRIRSLCPPSGGPWGSNTINQGAELLLESIFTPEIVAACRDELPDAFLDMMKKFDELKRSTKVLGQGISWQLMPELWGERTLGECLNEWKQRGRLIGRDEPHHHDSLSDGSVEEYRNGTLRLHGAAMHELFRPAIEATCAHVRRLLDAHPDCSAVCLVGGFATCDGLFNEVRNVCDERRIECLRPAHASLAVLQGAVRLGAHPAIATRMTQVGYGILVSTRVTPDRQYPGQPRQTHTMGGQVVEYVARIERVIEPGEEIEVDHAHEFDKGLRDDQDSFCVTVCTFEGVAANEELYPGDPRVRRLGRLEVNGLLAGRAPRPGRTLRIGLLVGGTEIHVRAVEENSGQTHTATINVLAR